MKNISNYINEQLLNEATERWIEFVWIDDEDCPKANAWLESNHKMSLSKFSEYLYDNLVTGDHDGNIFSSQGHSTAKEIKDAFKLRLPDGSNAEAVANELSVMPEIQDFIEDSGANFGCVLYIEG